MPQQDIARRAMKAFAAASSDIKRAQHDGNHAAEIRSIVDASNQLICLLEAASHLQDIASEKGRYIESTCSDGYSVRYKRLLEIHELHLTKPQHIEPPNDPRAGTTYCSVAIIENSGKRSEGTVHDFPALNNPAPLFPLRVESGSTWHMGLLLTNMGEPSKETLRRLYGTVRPSTPEEREAYEKTTYAVVGQDVLRPGTVRIAGGPSLECRVLDLPCGLAVSCEHQFLSDENKTGDIVHVEFEGQEIELRIQRSRPGRRSYTKAVRVPLNFGAKGHVGKPPLDVSNRPAVFRVMISGKRFGNELPKTVSELERQLSDLARFVSETATLPDGEWEELQSLHATGKQILADITDPNKSVDGRHCDDRTLHDAYRLIGEYSRKTVPCLCAMLGTMADTVHTALRALMQEYENLEFSTLRPNKQWCAYFGISTDTFKRRRDSLVYRTSLDSTDKAVAIAIDDLPRDYDDSIRTLSPQVRTH